MAKQLYLMHVVEDDPDVGVAYFGPFDHSEIETRLNDEFGESLSDSGRVEIVELSEEEAQDVIVNTRDYWFKALRSQRRYNG